MSWSTGCAAFAVRPLIAPGQNRHGAGSAGPRRSRPWSGSRVCARMRCRPARGAGSDASVSGLQRRSAGRRATRWSRRDSRATAPVSYTHLDVYKRQDQAYSQAHHDAACARYGDPAQLAKYHTLFVDSITVAGRLCLQWSKGQPQAYSDKTGKPDMRCLLYTSRCV